jgi:DNA-binding winged helix-turn-helix (wHTH) protein
VFLAQHPGQAFSRAQLMDCVWGYSTGYCDEKTVSVHISRLREKIEIEPASPELLLTVPGVGYRLAVAARDRRPRPGCTFRTAGMPFGYRRTDRCCRVI